MEETELQNELASIRSIMERSSKFISLSGLSGILAGVYALIGAGAAYYVLYNGERRDHYNPKYYSLKYFTDSDIGHLVIIALLVLIGSLITAYLLSSRQAKRKDQPIWGSASRSLLFHIAVPLFTGGILTLIFLFRGYYGIVSPSCLIFYGLALVGAASFTFGEVKYLGLCEIILGLVAACLPGYGLLFWALGFGVLHIIYGARIYFKYDK
ncbi:MAG TPA: hypothetical protein VHB54_21115 [Mucilaginibacter sp.]|nr:hypothetical protein [Mucilaginibacter sp.]